MKYRPLISALLLCTLAALIALALRHNGKGFTVIEQEQRNGYSCRLIEYNVSPDEKVQSYLLIPDGASARDRRPAIVMLHDHGARFDIGKEKLVRPVASAPENIRLSAQQWADDNFDGVYFAERMAKLGYVVIVPDMLYWGSRSTPLCQKWSRMKFCGEPGNIDSVKTLVYEGQRSVYDSLAAKGIIWAEQTLKEDAKAAGLVRSLDCVDGSHIGSFGWSMGAHRSWLLAAYCDSISTGAALCWMTLKQTCKQPYKASDYSMLIPELREQYDFPDIARKLAPKPFFFLNGKQDKLFPLWAVKESFRRMNRIYDDAGVHGQLRTEFFDGPHHCGLDVQETLIDFFRTTLPLPAHIEEHNVAVAKDGAPVGDDAR